MQCRFETAAGLMKSTASASYIYVSVYISSIGPFKVECLKYMLLY